MSISKESKVTAADMNNIGSTKVGYIKKMYFGDGSYAGATASGKILGSLAFDHISTLNRCINSTTNRKYEYYTGGTISTLDVLVDEILKASVWDTFNDVVNKISADYCNCNAACCDINCNCDSQVGSTCCDIDCQCDNYETSSGCSVCGHYSDCTSNYCSVCTCQSVCVTGCGTNVSCGCERVCLTGCNANTNSDSAGCNCDTVCCDINCNCDSNAHSPCCDVNCCNTNILKCECQSVCSVCGHQSGCNTNGCQVCSCQAIEQGCGQCTSNNNCSCNTVCITGCNSNRNVEST